MKKTYSAPTTQTVVIKSKYSFLSGSTPKSASGLDGFDGYGGESGGGMSSDSRENNFWDDEDY